MKLRSQFIVNVLARIVSRGSSIAANLIMTAIVARCLSETGFGNFLFLLMMIGVFVQVADFGTTTAISKLVNDREHDTKSLWGSFLTARLKLSVLAMLTAAVVIVTVSQAPLMWKIVAVVTIPFAASRFFEPVLQHVDAPWSIAWLSGGFAAGLVVATAIVGWLLPYGTAFLGAYLLANLLYLAAALATTRRYVRAEFRTAPTVHSAIWAIAWPVGWSGIFTTINSRASVLIVEAFSPSHNVGIFAAGMRILDLITAVAITVLTPMIPAICADASDLGKLSRRYWSVLASSCTIIGLFLLTIPVWAEPLALLLYGDKYGAVGTTLGIFAAVGCLAAICLLNSTVLMAVNRVKFAFRLTLWAAIINVGLCLALVPTFGYIAAAWVAVLVEGGMCTYTFVLIARHVGPIMSLELLGKQTAALAALAVAMILICFSSMDRIFLWATSAVCGLGYIMLATRLGLLGLRPESSPVTP